MAAILTSILLLLASVMFAQAQTPTPAPPVAIANGQGGVFVVRGNRVSVCVAGLVADINTPPAPHCGPATTLKP